MWAFLAVVFACAAAGLHLWWRARMEDVCLELKELRKELEETKEILDQTIIRARAHQQAVYDGMTDGILILDSNGRVRTTNKALDRLFSLERDVRGLTMMEALRCHELLEVIKRVRKEGQVRGFEVTLGELQKTRFVELNAACVKDAETEQEEIIFIFHDYTRIKELEGIRKDFVANVSHELRTPLTLIKGCVETLIDGAKEDPAVATKFLQTIQKHSNRLAFLIEDLLTISKLESGQVIVQPQFISLHPLVERVLEELNKPAALRDMILVNEVPENFEVFADADRFQQVLYNLVDNAIKYANSGGRAVIRAETRDGEALVSVQDNGPGIPAEARSRVFERFYRVDRARSREQGGTGLGLAIVKHIVQSHGGEAWVESELSKGCTFFTTLPFPQDASKERA